MTVVHWHHMEIHSSEFIKGIVQDHYTGIDVTLPQVVFYGRSNAGKSSTINMLTNRKALARTSQTPGRTTEINFFLINNAWYLVDMPGYGYARASKKQRETLHYLIQWFITHTDAYERTSVLIVDSKIGLTDTDKETLHMLREQGSPIIILMNKIDRLNQKTQSRMIKEIRASVAEDIPLVPFSAKTGRGKDTFFELLKQ